MESSQSQIHYQQPVEAAWNSTGTTDPESKGILRISIRPLKFGLRKLQRTLIRPYCEPMPKKAPTFVQSTSLRHQDLVQLSRQTKRQNSKMPSNRESEEIAMLQLQM